MPLSADHTVHLTRMWMVADALSQGHLRDWNPTWFFGTPVGELYPVLGDLLVVGLRGLGAWLWDWSAAYAIGLTLVFVGQGWVLLRIGKTMGLGPWPGWIAAALLLTDPGQYREGGWIYTIEYGVWPQALATALAWLAIGETLRALEEVDTHRRQRATVMSVIAFAGALLAHPMSLLVLALAAVILLAAYGIRGGRLGEVVVRGSTIVILGTGLAAWWLVPMLQHRAWMASYGWLWQPLEWMTNRAVAGHFAQNMPAPIGFAIMGGLVVTAIAGTTAARVLCCLAVVLWVSASQDVLWTLRLDRLSGGFAHVQYQRFIIAAKPGLYLAAGATVGWLFRGVRNASNGSPLGRATKVVAVLAGVAGLGVVGHAQWRAMVRHHVGEPQMRRIPHEPDFEHDYQRFVAWARTQWENRQGFYRIAFEAPRNAHWFMDSPVYTGTPSYKVGFTPGNNFVHKPEAGRAAVLDALGVTWVVRRRHGPSRPGSDLRFGTIRVTPRSGATPYRVAHIRGAGEVNVVSTTPDHTDVMVEVSGAGPESELVFAVAGYPRWRLEHEGKPVTWHEVPVTGRSPSATQDQRRSGQWRDGKAHGHDGSEPTLLAARAQDGTYHLTYRRWRSADVGGLLLTALAALGLGWVRIRGSWFSALEQRLVGIGGRSRLVILGVVSLAVAAVWISAQRRGERVESLRAVGWVDQAAASVSGMVASPSKVDMIIRPAVQIPRSHRGAAQAVFPAVTLRQTVRGWVAIDDDQAQMRRHGQATMIIEARPRGADTWSELLRLRLPHDPGRRPLQLPTGALAGKTVDLRVTFDRTGRPPDVAFDLELGAPPP